METNPAELYYSFGFVHLKLAGICVDAYLVSRKKNALKIAFKTMYLLELGMQNDRMEETDRKK